MPGGVLSRATMLFHDESSVSVPAWVGVAPAWVGVASAILSNGYAG